MKVAWGINERNTVTGALLAIAIFQIASLLPLVYILAVLGYPAIITSRNVLSVLFDVGIMVIPRIEALALSYLYAAASSETAVYFALLLAALIPGYVFGRILKGNRKGSLGLRKVLVVFIACDLVLRLLPFSFNLTFGLPAACIGWVCQAACLILIILDLRSAQEKANVEEAV